MYNSGNPLLWQPLSEEEIWAIKKCVWTNPELFESANYLEITNAIIPLLRKNFNPLASSILQKLPNYSQLWPEIEKFKKC